MTTWVHRPGHPDADERGWVDKEKLRATPEPSRGPHYWPDISAYRSPLSGKEVSSRRERREEMKVHNVREVEPTEWTPRYRNADFMRRRGIRNKD